MLLKLPQLAGEGSDEPKGKHACRFGNFPPEHGVNARGHVSVVGWGDSSGRSTDVPPRLSLSTFHGQIRRRLLLLLCN